MGTHRHGTIWVFFKELLKRIFNSLSPLIEELYDGL